MKGVVAVPNYDTGAADVGQIAKALLATQGIRDAAHAFAVRQKASDRTIHILEKSPVSGLTTGDAPELMDWRVAGRQFFNLLRTQSVFMRLLDNGFRRVPLRTRVGMVSTAATAYLRMEGAAFPVSKIALPDGSKLDPVSCGVIMVVTDELARSMTAEATNLIYAEMRGAVSYVVDDEFFSIVIDDSTPSTPSAGSMKEDVRVLLDAVNTTAGGALVWAMSPDVANDATILDERNAMTPLGGEFFGLPAIVAHSMPAGTLRLVNGAAIAAAADGMEMDASTQATLRMDSNPNDDPANPSEMQMLSLFQENCTALLAKISIAAHRLRDDAIAEVTGINWSA
jgi:hypothetical protein